MTTSDLGKERKWEGICSGMFCSSTPLTGFLLSSRSLISLTCNRNKARTSAESPRSKFSFSNWSPFDHLYPGVCFNEEHIIQPSYSGECLTCWFIVTHVFIVSLIIVFCSLFTAFVIFAENLESFHLNWMAANTFKYVSCRENQTGYHLGGFQ